MIIISKRLNEQRNAGPKAPSDICRILTGNKYKTFKENKYIIYKVLLYFLKLHFKKDIILIQHPVIYNNKVYSLLNREKTIILIHDISGLRNGNEELLKKELGVFKMFKYIIVHNNKMKQYLIDNGVLENNIYVLEIFDYIINDKENENAKIKRQNVTDVVYAGNLKKEKSPFVYQLNPKKMNYVLNLYGLGMEKSLDKKLKYNGSFEPEDVSTIKGDLGLVWDGNFDESDENLTFKRYTKYNNPHKLSLYMVCGIPVVVWKKSAIADFVKKYNVGYTISNVYDINNLKFDDYEEKVINARKIGSKLKNGYYTKKVINEILDRIGDKNER